MYIYQRDNWTDFRCNNKVVWPLVEKVTLAQGRLQGRMSCVGFGAQLEALPVLSSKLRLYCIRLSDKILILGNGGAKKSQTYEEDDELRGYVLTLQKFDKLLKEGVRDGSIIVTENTIDTNKTFEL